MTHRGAGTGPPALLLHGMLAHSGVFAPLMDRLADRLAMRALDLPGHGGTDRDAARDIQAEAAEDALASLATTGPAHLIGHSFGATVALRAAVARPDLVRGLVLIEPVAFAFLADAGHPGYAAELRASADFDACARAGDWPGAARHFLARWGAPGGYDALPQRQAQAVLARLPLVVAGEAAIRDTPAPRLRLADLAPLAMPVLLIGAAVSPPVAGQILDVIAAALPRSHRVTIAGAGHMLPVTHPGPVAAAIRAFLGPALAPGSMDES